MCWPGTSLPPCSLECSTWLTVLAAALSGPSTSLLSAGLASASSCGLCVQSGASLSCLAGEQQDASRSTPRPGGLYVAWSLCCQPGAMQTRCSCPGHLHSAGHQFYTKATMTAEWCPAGGRVQSQHGLLWQSLSYCLDVLHAGGQRDVGTLLAWALTILQRPVVTPTSMGPSEVVFLLGSSGMSAR